MFGVIPRPEKAKVGYPMPRWEEEFKTLFNRVFNGWPLLFAPYLEPEPFWGWEVKDAEKEVIVRAEVPGFEATDLIVEFVNHRLIIKAEKKPEGKEKGSAYAERCYERCVEVPVAIDPAKVEATYRNGVLEVHLPKMEEAKGIRIPIK
jgi:HSP20 family protein